EWIAREHHECDQPSNGTLAVGVGAEQFRDVAYGRRVRLDPATGGDEGGTFRLEIGKRHALALPLAAERLVVFALAFDGGKGGLGLAAPGRLRNCCINLRHT